MHLARIHFIDVFDGSAAAAVVVARMKCGNMVKWLRRQVESLPSSDFKDSMAGGSNDYYHLSNMFR